MLTIARAKQQDGPIPTFPLLVPAKSHAVAELGFYLVGQSISSLNIGELDEGLVARRSFIQCI